MTGTASKMDTDRSGEVRETTLSSSNK
jgi:hypothetical protein